MPVEYLAAGAVLIHGTKVVRQLRIGVLGDLADRGAIEDAIGDIADANPGARLTIVTTEDAAGAVADAIAAGSDDWHTEHHPVRWMAHGWDARERARRAVRERSDRVLRFGVVA